VRDPGAKTGAPRASAQLHEAAGLARCDHVGIDGREGIGGDRGAMASASVAFDLALYEAPSGLKLWTVRFDQIQSEFAANPFTAGHYPGRVSRFVSAAELAVKAMPIQFTAPPD
jgi:hypothetical protein